MTLKPVSEARDLILAAIEPLPEEIVGLAEAHGRVLARDLRAGRDQPPFAAAAMDGFAVRSQDLATVPATLKVIGQAPAGRQFEGEVGLGEAVRIFTGAPVPAGADTIVIQENAHAAGDHVTIEVEAAAGRHIRAPGLDFRRGEIVLEVGSVLNPRAIGLLAAMNLASVPVRRRPLVAILATGDELVAPGAVPRADQIVSSNSHALAAMVQRFGGVPLDLGIVRDEVAATEQAIASAGRAEVLVTIGGASVGEHDVVRQALQRRGISLGFWQIALRPGKPLMFARSDSQRILGLPGNPVSAMLCARLFLKPLIAGLLGLATDEPLAKARLETPLPANDHRQEYLRARLSREPDGTITAIPCAQQDSSMQRTLYEAQGLIIRAPHAAAATPGEMVDILEIDF